MTTREQGRQGLLST